MAETTEVENARPDPKTYRTKLGVASFPQGTLLAEWGDAGLIWTLDGYSRSHVAEMKQLEADANFLSKDPNLRTGEWDGEQLGYGMAMEVAERLGGEWKPAEETET